MNHAYSTFLSLKEKCLEEKKAKLADRTLKCYQMIEEMLGEGNRTDYLLSVQGFIEEKEYVTDKQFEMIDRIYRHRNDENEAGMYGQHYDSDQGAPF